MIDYKLPYGRDKLDAQVLESLAPHVLTSRLAEYHPQVDEQSIVDQALCNPIGSAPLRELAVGKNKVVILASDHTRPVPSRLLIPRMLMEIRQGNPDADITILIATGCHRGTTRQELENKFGSEILQNEKIQVHDCDLSPQVDLGELPSGGRLVLNQLAAQADLLVAEGFIEPHFFAGYSGGRKSVLPGVAARQTVLANHNGQFIADPHARTGVTEANPMHRDMVWAARKAGLAFICNVVLNEEKHVVYAVAGDCEQAHEAGCCFLKKMCGVQAPLADLVVTTNGGYPLDQNIYQAVKGMTAAETLVKPGGVIIMAAKAEDGHGGDEFFRMFQQEKNPQHMMETFEAVPPEKTRPDQWQAQIFARVLCRARVIFLSSLPDNLVENFQMIPAHSMEEALIKAKAILKKERWDTLVIPDGVSVIPTSEPDQKSAEL